MKYCTRCGAELVDEAVVCPKCGCAVGGAVGPFVAGASSGVGKKFVAGLVTLVLGVVGLIYSLVTMNSAMGKFQRAVDDSYNNLMIGILVVSIIVAVVGVVLLLIKKKPLSEKQLKRLEENRKKNNRALIILAVFMSCIVLFFVVLAITTLR